MYSKKEASAIRQKFWTSFGRYMLPVKAAEGAPVNWINYKTGIPHIYIRMDAGKNGAVVAIELRHADEARRQYYFNTLQKLKAVLEQITGEEWDWEMQQKDEDGNRVSRVSRSINGLSVFNEADWPAIISFLKPRIISLDEFWMIAKDSLQ